MLRAGIDRRANLRFRVWTIFFAILDCLRSTGREERLDCEQSGGMSIAEPAVFQ